MLLMNLLLRCAAVSCAVLSTAAVADCKPITNALEAMAKQTRRAMYDVPNSNTAPKGKPMIIIIGPDVYTEMMAGKYYTSKGGDNPDPMVQKIRATEKKGEMKCLDLGNASYRGTAVNKYQFENPMAKSNPGVPADSGRTTLWVSKSSGLPIYQEIKAATGGFAIVYGSAVPNPPASAGDSADAGKDMLKNALGGLKGMFDGK